MADFKGGEKLGGVAPDPISRFRPSKDFPKALDGRMSWDGYNNEKKNDPKTSERARKY